MKSIEKISVSIAFYTSESLDVGEVVLQNEHIYFKYFDRFIQTGLKLSPLKVPFNTAIYKGNKNLFEGLPGFLQDALPDAWGRLLLDRMVATRGINYKAISPLDRLAFVGKEGFGALQFEPSSLHTYKYQKELSLDKIASESSKILSNGNSALFETLKFLAGSSGGARPKIEVNFNPKTKELLYDEKDVLEGFEPWIIKFPTQIDGPDAALIEYAYYLMAQDAGINMSTSNLFEGENGTKYFGTKRFDRTKNSRLHMHSAAGLLHDDFQHSQMDYGHLLDLAFKLEKSITAYEQVFRLATFNLFTHNRDDHSKNFSFLMNSNGNWQFAPAYDLTFSSSSYGFHSTTFAGEGKNPSFYHLIELAKTFDIPNAKQIIEEVRQVVLNWTNYAKSIGVSTANTLLINKEILRLTK